MILNDANRNYKCPPIFSIEREFFRLIFAWCIRLTYNVLMHGLNTKLYTIISIYPLLHIVHVIGSLAAIALPARYY